MPNTRSKRAAKCRGTVGYESDSGPTSSSSAVVSRMTRDIPRSGVDSELTFETRVDAHFRVEGAIPFSSTQVLTPSASGRNLAEPATKQTMGRWEAHWGYCRHAVPTLSSAGSDDWAGCTD